MHPPPPPVSTAPTLGPLQLGGCRPDLPHYHIPTLLPQLPLLTLPTLLQYNTYSKLILLTFIPSYFYNSLNLNNESLFNCPLIPRPLRPDWICCKIQLRQSWPGEGVGRGQRAVTVTERQPGDHSARALIGGRVRAGWTVLSPPAANHSEG